MNHSAGDNSESDRRAGHVLHVYAGNSADSRFGGVPVAVETVASAQAAAGQFVTVLSPWCGRRLRRDQSGTLKKTVYTAAINLASAGGYGAIFSPLLPIRAVTLIRRAGVVHIHLCRDVNMLITIALVVLMKTPAIIQTHGMMERPNSAVMRRLERVLMGPLMARVPVALTLTNSENVHIKELTNGRCTGTRFPNGVKLTASPLSLSARKLEVLCIGRIHPRKNVPTFVRAAQQASLATDAGWTFCVVGPDAGDLGPVREVVSRDATARSIRIEPAILPDAAVARIARALLLVQPAPSEPFGLTIAEALAQGTPVILHDTSALAEMVASSGAGFVFDGTSEALAGIIDRFVDEPALWIKASFNALEVARAHFNIDDIVDALGEYYSIIRARHRNGATRWKTKR